MALQTIPGFYSLLDIRRTLPVRRFGWCGNRRYCVRIVFQATLAMVQGQLVDSGGNYPVCVRAEPLRNPPSGHHSRYSGANVLHSGSPAVEL